MEAAKIYKEFLEETKIDENLIKDWQHLPMNTEWKPVVPYSICIELNNGARIVYTSKYAVFNDII